MDIVSIRDYAEGLIAAATPSYMPGMPYHRATGSMPIEMLEHSATSTSRTYEVRPGAVRERGSYTGTCFEVLQEIEVIVAYGIDPRAKEDGLSSWRVVRAMSAADSETIVQALERPPLGTTWAGLAHNISIQSSALPDYTGEAGPVFARHVFLAHYSQS